jgi:hypothetical protein
VLGDAKVENGRVLPFSEVRCDEVRKALSYLAPAASPEQRQVALGMAMARVVAHELYHMLARTTRHAMHGLARASQPLPELVSSRKMVFERQDSEAIRKGFDAPPECGRPDSIVHTIRRLGLRVLWLEAAKIPHSRFISRIRS